MTRIQILPDHVANQIAAGEVVERPASVVKELVENAIDAGAERVEIELRNGGKTSIRVSDDGSGMEREDALLALDRHATSKIEEADDLQAVSSFGFRGEALPSIAAVSRFELETATGESEVGTRIRARGGKILSVDDVVRRPGTTVTVRSLFHNQPARAKYLRAASAETRSCSETITLLALSSLRVGFRLESNGRELLELSPADTLKERVAGIWGREEARDLLSVDHTAGPIRVGGLVEKPDAARSGGRRRYLFVNGRPFSDRGLVKTVDEAYRTTVAPDVRPTFFLYFSLPPSAVDVNVHPRKAEVRFGDRSRVEEAAREAVRQRLADLESAPTMGPAAGETRESAGDGEPGEGEVAPAEEADRVGAPRPGRGTAERGGVTAGEGSAPAPSGAGEPTRAGEAGGDGESQLALFMRQAQTEAGEGEDSREMTATAEAAATPDLYQVHRSYILAQTREGLLIIDQHAAHERILFEEVMRHFEGETGEASQRLLFPLTLRLSPAEYQAVEELSGLLEQVGFEVEPFGDRTVIVHASPQPHPYFDAEGCFRDMIRELTEGSELVNSARNQHEKIAKSMACQGAIKAGQPLSQEEMAELFDRLFATELPGHDVHGRPTVVRLTLEELERRFGRS